MGIEVITIAPVDGPRIRAGAAGIRRRRRGGGRRHGRRGEAGRAGQRFAGYPVLVAVQPVRVIQAALPEVERLRLPPGGEIRAVEIDKRRGRGGRNRRRGGRGRGGRSGGGRGRGYGGGRGRLGRGGGGGRRRRGNFGNVNQQVAVGVHQNFDAPAGHGISAQHDYPGAGAVGGNLRPNHRPGRVVAGGGLGQRIKGYRTRRQPENIAFRRNRPVID